MASVKATGVILELSAEEASALYAALSHVGGEYTSRRVLTDEIYEALEEAGVRSDFDDLKGNLEFKETK